MVRAVRLPVRNLRVRRFTLSVKPEQNSSYHLLPKRVNRTSTASLPGSRAKQEMAADKRGLRNADVADQSRLTILICGNLR